MNATESKTCTVCTSPLERDGMCLVCLLNEGIEAAEQSPGPRSMMGALPCEFAGHRLEREIASGGMGMVFEAVDLKLKRRVAMKVIRDAQFARRDEAARFRTEMKAIARLLHPHIIPVYESGEVDGTPYFTMRLAEGGSLAERLQKHGAMPVREAAAMMASIAHAVQHAHDRGVLHRDLKPANILLDAEGSPLLADFGLAKQLDGESQLTRSGMQLGTLHYMSPEQADVDTQEVTTASDVWALGVLLSQMLTNRLPFPGGSAVEVIRRITQAEPDLGSAAKSRGESTPALEVSKLPPDLATLIRRCLEKKPEKRLRSAGFLAEELERYLAGDEIESRPVTGIDLIWRKVLRHKAAAAAILVAVLCLLAGTTVSLWQASEARAALEVAQQQKKEADTISDMTMNTLMGLRTRSSSGRVVNRAEALQKLLAEVRRFKGDPVRKARMLTDVGAMTANAQTLELYREAVRLAEGALAPDEPQLWRFRFLATSQWCIVDTESDEALAALRGVLTWQREHIGPEHGDTVITLFALGKALNIHDRPEEAQVLLEEACRLAVKRKFKPFNITNYRIYYLEALHAAGHADKAHQLGREFIPQAREALGKEHVLLGELLALHAGHCLADGRIAEARETGREGLKVLWSSAGPDYVDAIYCLEDMLTLAREHDGLEACLKLQKEALHVADQWHGPLHSLTAEHAAACADLLQELNRPSEAETLCQTWLERMRSVDGKLPAEAEPLLEALRQLKQNAPR